MSTAGSLQELSNPIRQELPPDIQAYTDPMPIPNDLAPLPIELMLRGCQAREMNALPAAPPMAENEM